MNVLENYVVKLVGHKHNTTVATQFETFLTMMDTFVSFFFLKTALRRYG